MARKPKFDYGPALMLELQKEPEGLALDDLLDRTGLQADRTTIFRHLSRLIDEGQVERLGKARASRYRAHASATATTPGTAPTDSSLARLLEAYRPSRTPYLQPRDLERLTAAGMPAAGSAAKQWHQALELQTCLASARIAGAGYTEAEAEALFRIGAIAADREARDATLLLNHREALRQIADSKASVDLGSEHLRQLHALLVRDLAPRAPESPPQELRDTPVAPAAQFSGEFDLDAVAVLLGDIDEPFEQAFCTLLFLPAVAPYADKDVGASRIAANIPLLKSGFCPLTYAGVERGAWDAATRAARHGDPAPLRQLFIESYLRGAERVRQERVERIPVCAPVPDLDAVVRKAVRTIVRDWKRFNRVNLEIYLSLLVSKDHVRAAVAAVEHALAQLHPGNIAEFGLTAAEFACYTPPVGIGTDSTRLAPA